MVWTAQSVLRIFIVLISLFSARASAESATEALKTFGLIGTWSDNCALEPGKGSVRITFSTPVLGTPALAIVTKDRTQTFQLVSAVRVTEEKIKIKIPKDPRGLALGPQEFVISRIGNKLGRELTGAPLERFLN